MVVCNMLRVALGHDDRKENKQLHVLSVVSAGATELKAAELRRAKLPTKHVIFKIQMKD